MSSQGCRDGQGAERGGTMMKKSGTSYFKDLSRKDYVELASRIIKEEGVGAVSKLKLTTTLRDVPVL